MNDKFLKLPEQKQQQLLKAICEEFTEHSYADASTNRIVEKAGISKGTLFNYFGCKEAMYHDLFRYVIEFFKGYAIDEFPTDDFLERCYLLAEKDMKIYYEAPHLLDFFATIYAADQSQIPADITATVGILLTEAMEKLYTGVDYSLFRSDVDATVLMQMIRYTFDGYLQEVIGKIKTSGLTVANFEEFMVDYRKFLAEAKKIYYQNGGVP